MKRTVSSWIAVAANVVACAVLWTAGGQAQTPLVRAIVNAANSDPTAIARGSFMSIYGQNFGAQTGPPSSLPLPTTLGTTQVTIKSGSSTYKAFLHFVSPGQINAILPSAVPAGAASMTVTVGTTTSSAAPFFVVESSLGMFTLNSQPAGMAIAQNFESATSLPLNLYTNPARQGQTMILWGTGLGAYTAGSDDGPPQAGNIVNNATVLVAGIEITPFYAGRAPGIPGVDQINFTLPDNIPDGCSLYLQVQIPGSNQSGSATIAKSSDAPVCQHSFGISTDQLSSLQSGGSLKAALAVVQRGHGILGVSNGKVFGTLSEQVRVVFQKFAAYSSPLSNQNLPFSFSQAAGTCAVIKIDGTNLDFIDFDVNPQGTNLDAGSGLMLSGPSTSMALNSFGPTKIYDGADIPGVSSAQSVLVDGDWTISGSGGHDIGPFSAPFTLQNQFKLTSVPTTIKRGQTLTLGWSGGGSSDSDTVRLIAFRLQASGLTPVVICTAPANAGTFDIPGNLTGQLAGDFGQGVLLAYNVAQPVHFSAPLVAGGSLDSGVISFGILESFLGILVQ
jgi:uncharacterized protein (TIGR03437 family)